MNDFFVFLSVSYLLGSLSPGYLFGRTVKGIDVRDFGNKNTGATNTYKFVGPVYGIITGIFDALKAFVSYLIAVNGISGIGLNQISPDTAIFVGIATVAGHIWPFYIKFRGGRGAASLFGLAIIVLYYTTSWYALAFVIGAIIYGMIFNQVPFEAPVRKILKIIGLSFPLGLFWFDGSLIINITSALLIISVVFDMSRFVFPHINVGYLKLRFVAKSKETKFFSGYTLFLTGTLVVLKYFSPEISIFVISAFIIADIIAPAGKEALLPIPLVKEKTVGGALVVFASAFLVGMFLTSLSPLSLNLKTILSGAVIMAFFDQLSFAVDDNLLVPIGTAIILATII